MIFEKNAARKEFPGCFFSLPIASWRHRSRADPQIELC